MTEARSFADLYSFSKAFCIENFVCNAYCSWEKGCVEDGNREVRKFIPQGTDLKSVTQAQLDDAACWINNTPMIILKKKTPNDVWFLACKDIKEMLH